MTPPRSLVVLGLLVAAPISAAQIVNSGAQAAPAPSTQQVPRPVPATTSEDPSLPADPMLGAIPMSCTGDHSTEAQTLYFFPPTCSNHPAMDAALIQSLTNAANDVCAPTTACGVTFSSFSYMGYIGVPQPYCSVTGSITHFGCNSGGGGGGGGGGCGPGGCDG
jgi:hypothetical protein